MTIVPFSSVLNVGTPNLVQPVRHFFVGVVVFVALVEAEIMVKPA